MSVNKFGSSSSRLSNNTNNFTMSLENLIRKNSDGQIDMNNKKIINTAYPENDNDVATLSFVQDQIDELFLSDINMHNYKITNLALPRSNNDAVTKAYSDLNLLRSGGTMDGDIDMNNNKIINIPSPSNGNDCASKKYVDNKTRTKFIGSNTFVGQFAGKNVVEGRTGINDNIGIGNNVLEDLIVGNNNVAIGNDSLHHNGACSGNVAIGVSTFRQLNDGDNNIAIGYDAGSAIRSNSYNNILIGHKGVHDENDTIRIGSTAQTACYIAGIHNSSLDGATVRVNSTGQLGVMRSSQKYKKNITNAKNYDISNLRVVNFKFVNSEKEHIGLIAEEVVNLLPEIIIYDKDNKPDSIDETNLLFIMLQKIQQLERKNKEFEIKLNQLNK